MPEPAAEREPPHRRAFLRFLIRALGLVWAGGVSAAALSYLRLPSRLRTSSSQAVEVGPETDLRPGEGRMVTGDHPPFWVVHTEAGALLALPAECTHRRCILTWQAQTATLLCPCHGGSFDLNGNVLGGPPPRPLPSLPLSVKGGTVYVYI